MSSKRQYRKSGLIDGNNQIIARRDVRVYGWCRIVLILLSDNTLLVIVDIYDVWLTWRRLKSSSKTCLFFLTILIKSLQNILFQIRFTSTQWSNWLFFCRTNRKWCHDAILLCTNILHQRSIHFSAVMIAILQSYFSAMASSCPAHVDMALLWRQYIACYLYQC